MEQFATPDDFGNGEKGEVRRWLSELSMAEKREKDWRKLGQSIIDRYRGKGRRKNSFNILWSNTETLAPAVFNSPPQPNVRRRFKDADPVGKVVSTVLERCLEFQTDTEEFVSALTLDVLDMLLPGRGVSRIKYVPAFKPGMPAPEGVDQGDDLDDELAWEQCTTEHVQWDDFRHGPGKTWSEVEWVAYRHRLTRDGLIKKFGEAKGKLVTLDEPADDDLKKDAELCEVFQTAAVWEIWFKGDKKVRFVAPNFRNQFLQVEDDPLELSGFFPSPKPLYAINDSTSLDPVPLYEQYREQAEELNRISVRINKIIDALKVRGLYDSTMAELSELMKGDDNDLIPVQNVAAWIEKGGIEKAIWMMPIADAANVLKVLYEQREATKQVIYEITGIADVMRGSTDPNETLGAQQLKAQWGGQRVQSLQREVQRYARDLIRIMAEVVSERFQPETLLKMTNMQIPSEVEVQQKAQEYQMAAQQAQSAGQQPPPPPEPPDATLEQVMGVLRDDATRMFKVDVETDSMVAATMQQDMQAMEQTLGGITSFITGIGPAVQAGAFPIEAVKEIILSVSRRAKLGSIVEDALEKIKQPAPQSDPNAAAQQKAQSEQKIAEQQQMHDQQIAQRQQQHEEQIAQRQQMHQEQLDRAEQQREEQRFAMEQRMDQQRLMMEDAAKQREEQAAANQAHTDAKLEILLAHIKKDSAVEVATINNEGKIAGAKITAENKPEPTNDR